MTKPLVDPLVGRTVAHYEILARLGGGGMGVVYKAHDIRLGRTLALKFLPQQWSHDEGAKQRFVREAQAASATDHPNICTIHDIETADDGQLFIVMAYYEGPTLKQRLEQGPLPIDEALDIASQIADGLAKAHAQGVVHRDIKPGNLILTEEGIRIVDFGLATFAEALQLTVAGSTLGTAAYMSPEQLRGEDVDARTDVWAAGVVLYQMLTGHVPFRGAYAEAIAYAIRNDAPAPLRGERPEIPEELEQLVFRALHKDAAVRFASGRELARALRQTRGQTVPLDQRTIAVVVNEASIAMPVPVRRRRIVAAMAVMALLAATTAWVFLPVDRVAIAVTPVANRTGYQELDGFELALAEELASALRDSPAVRVVAPERVREIVRPFRKAGSGAIGPAALQAISRHGAAGILLVPTLVHENGAFRARVEVRDASSATSDEPLWTEGKTSSLLPATAYELTVKLAPLIEAYFVDRGSWRARVAHRLRHLLFSRESFGVPRMTSLDAAAAFERGLDAYERFEYASALQAFMQALARDPRNALLEAWRSRTALVMRRDADAAEAADRAARLPTETLPATERVFVEAVIAEAGRAFDTAEARYAALVEHDPQDPVWLIEQAAFLDRRGRDRDAVLTYQRVLELDKHRPRPELELCRLYGPTRLNQILAAKESGERARADYTALGSEVGQAQAAMCLADSLREGDAADRREARQSAEQARALLERQDAPYQLARALYYIGLTAFAEQRFAEAATAGESALTAARRAENVALEPFLLQSLGGAHLALGHRRQHIEYTRASADLFAARGEDERAAGLQANAGAALIDFGDDPTQGFRMVQNALNVFRRFQNTTGEVFALQVTAAYHRNAGRHIEADELLNQALTISAQFGLKARMWSLHLDRARSLFELGDYVAARTAITDVLETISGRDRIQAEIWLAQIETRLGQFGEARSRLAAASAGISPGDGTRLLLFQTAMGELEYEGDRRGDARGQFRLPASLWGTELPHFRTVEASAYAGLLDAIAGDVGGGEEVVEKSLVQARLMGRLGLETRCRVFLARIVILVRRFDDALRVLKEVPADEEKRTIGPELRAQVHYWTGQALHGRGEAAAGDTEIAAAKRLLRQVRERLPSNARDRFAARADVRRVLE